MAKKTNIIELNGKRYDAVTGQLLRGGTPASSVHATPTHPARKIDGFIHPKYSNQPTKPHTSVAAAKKTVPQYKPAVAAKPSGKPVMDIAHPRQTKGNLNPHKPQQAKTLIRYAVKKPSPSLKRSLKVQTRTDILAKTPTVTVVPKSSYYNLDQRRIEHAKQVAKNRMVSRYRVAKASTTAHLISPKPTLKPTSPNLANRTVQSPRPVYAASSAAYNPGAIQRSQPAMDIFQRALVRANSHEQQYKQSKKSIAAARRPKLRNAKRNLGFATGVLALLLIGGFITYQNGANITMRIASARAGFSASLPEYKPDGFSVGKFSYNPGMVAVNYTDRSGQDNYKLTEKTSNWNSQALLENYVVAHNASYDTIEAAGRTIFIYGNNNATWVNNGIWYQIDSNGSLSNTDIVNLATSM